MKITKPAVLVIFGILATLLITGCSNPSFPSGGGAGDIGPGTYSGPGIDLDRPFTVTFTLGQSETARSVAGPDANRIYMTGADGIRNFVQLVVVDEQSKEIKGFAEDRKTSGENNEFTLTLDNLVRGKEYAFLLLMGYWERGPNNGNNYTYTETKPTLLCAGLAEKTVNITGDTEVTITMYPITVDTKFIGNNGGSLTVEPKIVDGDPDAAYLVPGSWHVKWTVQRAVAGTDGFERALIPAQEIVGITTGDLKIKEKRIILSGLAGSEVTLNNGSTAETFSFSILDYFDSISSPKVDLNDLEFLATNPAAKAGWAINFNLEYVPFGLADADWSDLTSTYFDLSTGGPVWIIRNGLNDDRQDKQTNFSQFGNPGYNGNGAVEFGVWPPQQPGEPLPPDQPHPTNNLWVDDGKFAESSNLSSKTEPTIEFTAGGWNDGYADIWYAVVQVKADGSPGDPPEQRDYIWRISYEAPGPDGETHGRDIKVPAGYWETGYDVYVIVSKDGEVSAPEVIKHRRTGDATVDWEWGTETVTDMNLTPYLQIPFNGTLPSSISDTAPQYTGTASWSPYDSPDWPPEYAPVPPNSLIIKVVLTAKPGYTFTGLGDDDFFYNTWNTHILMKCDENTGNTITLVGYYVVPVPPQI
ncbi:hypothetical protein LQZ21_09270 [Treponema sp. TIM-1]|uniref:hypothetical protein n=1 Tax=Treponema sp. TIM-1 TaxID=2898417 RepID=UPI003980B282